MKKYLSLAILATIAIAGGCTKELYGPAPEPEAKVEAKGISVKVSEVKDSSFVVSLTPEDTSAVYYSYAVVEGALSAVDSSSLYSDGYKSAAVASGVIKNVSPYTSSVAVGGLTPNTAYTVYAVSSSSTGVPGSVSSVSVTTSDNLAPYIVDDATKENVASLQFSEPVYFVEGSAVTVNYYGINSSEHDIYNNDPVGTATASVRVNEDVAVFVLSDVPDGAYYTVSFPEGAFTDAAGNKAEALESYFAQTSSGDLGAAGLAGRVSTKAYSFVADSVEIVTDLAAPIALAYPEGTTPARVSNKVTGTITYVTASAGTATYSSIAPGANGGYLLNATNSGVVVYPNIGEAYSGRPEPARGATVTIEVPADYVIDIYGNGNAAYTVGPFLYSYGYTAADDLFGSYEVSSTSAYAKYGYGPYTDTLTLAASDSTGFDVAFSGTLAGLPVKFYATFNGDTGELEIPTGQTICKAWDYLYDSNGYPTLNEDSTYVFIQTDVHLVLSNGGSSYYRNNLGFDVPASHTLSFWYPSYYLGLLEYYQGDAYNWNDQVQITSVKYIEPAAGTSVKAAAVKPASAKAAKPRSKPVSKASLSR